ncbi:hypothetical protein ACHAXT_001178 [Thalassiosira profunda]
MDHAADGRLIAAGGKRQTQVTQQPREILEEEEYQSTLSSIVTRDYFPSLHSLRRDAAILEARSRGDVAGAVAVRRAARREEMERERELNEEREAEQEAVAETAVVPHRGGSNNVVQVRKRPRPLKHETVTGFHARVTSEDNAEFEGNQERERRDREKHLGVVYAAKADKHGRLMIEASLNDGDEESGDKDNAKNARSQLCDTPLGLASDLYDAPPSAGLRITKGSDDKTAESNNGIGRNGLFFQPQHRPNDDPTNARSDTLRLTSGAPSGGTFLALENGSQKPGADKEEGGGDKSDNLLMPPPPARQPASSAIAPYQETGTGPASGPASQLPAIDNRSQLVEYLPKPELPDIHPPATRFPYQNESSRLLAKASNNMPLGRSSSGSTAGSYTDTSATTDLDASLAPIDAERVSYQKARRRENETFVAMTPLILPGGGSRVGEAKGGSNAVESDEPIMTWGDVASTPMVLSGTAVDCGNASSDWEPSRPASMADGAEAEGQSVGPSFDVIDDTSREVMARRAEKGLTERSKTYRAAGTSGLNKRDDEKDDESRDAWKSE